MRAFLLILACFYLNAEETILQKTTEIKKNETLKLEETRNTILSERELLYSKISETRQKLDALRKQEKNLIDNNNKTELEIETQKKEIESIVENEDRKKAVSEALGFSYNNYLKNLEQYLNDKLSQIINSNQITKKTETIINRDGKSESIPVLRLGKVMAIAIGDKPTQQGFINDSLFDTPSISGVIFAPETGNLISTDPSGTLISVEREDKKTFSGWMKAGGVFAWCILALLLFAVILGIERIVSLSIMKTKTTLADKTIEVFNSQGKIEAEKIIEKQNNPMSRILKAGINLSGKTKEQKEAALEAALLAEEPRFERSLSLLAVCAAIAPLLGLLGTVTGMISTFDVISVHGTENTHLLSGGISEALLTTQMGLLVAIPILLFHALINRTVDKKQTILDQTATMLLTIEEK